jgi:hypothetical protein
LARKALKAIINYLKLTRFSHGLQLKLNHKIRPMTSMFSLNKNLAKNSEEKRERKEHFISQQQSQLQDKKNGALMKTSNDG